MVQPKELEAKISELLDNFYKRRVARISEIKIDEPLRKKNPYLYRAIGIDNPSQIVEGILTALVTSSDEGIFGDAFFEPLAIYASGGTVAPAKGIDVAVETPDRYLAIAVKSGPSVFNAQSKGKQADEFRALRNRLNKLHKHFDPLVGYAYGKKKQRGGATAEFRELAGQAFWQELTGDPDFYLKIVRLMKDKPVEHAAEFKEAWRSALDRLTKEFVDKYCKPDGTIDWELITQINSGTEPVRSKQGAVEYNKPLL